MTQIDFSGKTVLVTGGARRLGRSLSQSLADAGAEVAVHYNTSAEEAEAFLKKLISEGRRIELFQADLEQQEQCEALIPRVIECFGKIDILINSASVYPDSPLATLNTPDMNRIMAINSLAPFYLTRVLAETDQTAQVINFLDGRMDDFDRKRGGYGLSKKMLKSLTMMTALEYAPQIRVNAVAPGMVLPPEGMGENALAQIRSANPLKTLGTIDQIIEAVFYLCGSGYMTGQILYIDGGRHLRGVPFL